ncbi:RPB5 subunit of DNA-directed RNA polymerase [Piedraia hortae CBS 480.64]|uniref:DNA-directed RNA polymerases I, II, and III subunit RPABC1 n=1 Tax=Piedraia hortae CBS 480.64 TaxID=1314780 RepID=A0A6A7BXQ2_9PEZI|nr:RPB5 subunit of DNA-directed RNA polymerase [Piedraia hortae CBS 480.64]
MAEGQNREVVRLWRVLRTTKQMCADRGYKLPEDECNITLADFTRLYTNDGAVLRESMCFSADPTPDMIEKYTPIARAGQPKPEAAIGRIYIQFNNDANVGTKQLKNFAQLLNERNYQGGIFISAAKPTRSAAKLIPSVLPTVLEMFQEEDLLVNISRHELVPKHTLLSPQDKKRLLDRYRLKETQLPRINHDDPMARYLGLRRGQVVKIIRKSETAGRYASYRWTI